MKDDGHINFEANIIPLPSRGLSVFLLWMKLWLSCVWPFEVVYEYEFEETDDVYYTYNRVQRRRSTKVLPSHRYVRSFRPLMLSGLTRGQFLERCSRYSILGRRRFYFILNWLKHLSRYLQLRICGRIKALNTFSDLGLTNGGLWDAHLWPS